MENTSRKEKSFSRISQTGCGKRPSKVEEDREGQQQSSQRRGRKRVRESYGEAGSGIEEERERPSVRCRRSHDEEDDVERKRQVSSRSAYPMKGPSTPSAQSSRIPSRGQREIKTTAREDRTSGRIGQAGQQVEQPIKTEENGQGKVQSPQKQGRKRSIRSHGEGANNITPEREKPSLKRRRSGEEEDTVERKKQGSSLSANHGPSPSHSSAPSKASFTSLYTVGKLLGEGGCGSVYAGTRKADGKQVAIKYVTSSFSKSHLTIPGESQSLPLEVALMELVCRPPACSHVIQLLDWFEEPDYVILVLELPSPCLDVSTFTKQLGGYMEESLAQVIMRQVVQAALHCRERGVLHRDIKSKNLLIQTDDFHVKLIDFGCGDLLKDDPYRQFAGTRPFRPPEWVRDGEYHGRPATIWSLGVLLYVLVCGAHPFRREEDIIAADLQFKAGLSTDCRNLIRWCLQKDPSKRPVLEQILQHDWMRS